MSEARQKLLHIDLSKLEVHKSLVKEIDNWASIEALWAFSRVRRARGSKVTVRFRDGAQISADCEALGFVILAIHLSSMLGSDSVSHDVQILSLLSDSITARLIEVYPLADLQNSRTGGGFPGQKDSLLWLLVRLLKPHSVVETGVAQGVSTTFILDALERNGSGRLVSIDFPDSLAIEQGKVGLSSLEMIGPSFIRDGLKPGWIVPRSLIERWKLILGPAQEVLPTLAQPVDLFFHDSLHTYDHMMFEFNWTDSHSLPGTVLVADDISWNSAFRDFVRQHHERWHAISTRGAGVAVRL